MREITESDWKKYSKLRPVALERMSQRILDECQALCQDSSRSAHERYGELYRLIREQDEILAAVFDRFSRSSAHEGLVKMVCQELVTDEEVAQFSPEFQKGVLNWRDGL
ncbi:peptide ABC transporter substrate-binding protein [Pseudomonas sp. BN417]|uniref:hypothetical protein n=1 Tax=Pseudomonas sp. BN417 TaxID=2567890 RepID=UPI00245464DD|nr:hypothetical protein [Pseudomonas sp. BN417]MDH4559250.1 peptide ABC transporter substrate-binding protein [Pseudomonas sp. BN417]